MIRGLRSGASCGETGSYTRRMLNDGRLPRPALHPHKVSRPRVAACGPAGALPARRRRLRRTAENTALPARLKVSMPAWPPAKASTPESGSASPVPAQRLPSPFRCPLLRSSAGSDRRGSSIPCQSGWTDAEQTAPRTVCTPLMLKASQREQAGNQADACAGADRDPGRPLAAHIERDRPCRGGSHPEQPKNPTGESPLESNPAGTASIRAARMAGFQSTCWRPHSFGPALRRCLPAFAFRRVDQLRQSAGRAVAVVGLDGLVAAVCR